MNLLYSHITDRFGETVPITTIRPSIFLWCVLSVFETQNVKVKKDTQMRTDGPVNNVIDQQGYISLRKFVFQRIHDKWKKIGQKLEDQANVVTLAPRKISKMKKTSLK